MGPRHAHAALRRRPQHPLAAGSPAARKSVFAAPGERTNSYWIEIHLHIVWVTKYRRKVLVGEVAHRARDLIRQVCGDHDVTIMKGHVSKDHVHVFVSAPPQVTISRLVQRMKGKSAYKLLGEFSHLRRQFWGRHLWARGYFCRSSGNVTDEEIAAYIDHQRHDSDTEFKIDGEESP